jgi:hypothetical protein
VVHVQRGWKWVLYATLWACSVLAHAGGWQISTQVKHYVIEGSDAGERLYVMFANNFNPDGCTNPDSYFIRLNVSTPKGRAMFTSLVTAKAMNQNVVPYVGGCDDWNRPILQGLQVVP